MNVGAIMDRPQILPKQNLFAPGENCFISLREIRNSMNFGGRSMIAPTKYTYPFRNQYTISNTKSPNNLSLRLQLYKFRCIISKNMLIGFIQQGPKSVIPRSGATWESPGTASVIAAFYQEIATPYGLAM
ncbi:MAG: hypothetical protein IJX04_08300, partial [Oscillospiraceae bacterium]|nr:hypothetical protein [Oscillospiraceae bacterium]